MHRYIGTQCPVCKREFEQGDDIVTCPDCGTPHHRECYSLIGKCVNNGLHGSGYTFEGEAKTESVKEDSTNAVIGEYYTPNNESTSNKPPIINGGFDVKSVESEYSNSNEKIDDNEIGDVAATIRVNIPRFIDKFRNMERTNKKLGWNWGAFFFGGLYYLFRKMYKQGISLIFIFVAILYGSDTLLFKFAPDYIDAVKSAAEAYASGGTLDPNALMTADTMTAMKIIYGVFALILVIRIISAMLADYCYKNTVSEIISRVNKHLEENMTFVQSPMMMQNEPQLSQEQMKKMYLARKGGVSLFTPTLAVFIIYNLMYIL